MSGAPIAEPSIPSRHIPALDGVRAVSILAVLAAHLLPLKVGEMAWNGSVGMFGMALFFVLSGFLITTQLLGRPSVSSFVARRLFRIVPLAWLCTGLVAILFSLEARDVLGYLFFWANLPPQRLPRPLDHFWSLCVEVHFYGLAALLLWLRPAAIRWFFPALLLALTGLRIAHDVTAGSITWYRADDLLAGATLALLIRSTAWVVVSGWLRRQAVLWIILLLLILASILPPAGSENYLTYLRPYAAATFVAAIISRPEHWLTRWMAHKVLAYIAAVSYSLYVWHMPLAATWLGSGDIVEKYLKRPLLFLCLFIVAHLSTFHFERYFNDFGRRVK